MKKTMKQIREQIDFWKQKTAEEMPNGLKVSIDYLGYEAPIELKVEEETAETMQQIEKSMAARKNFFDCNQLLRKANSIIIEESGMATIEMIEKIKLNQKLISSFDYFNKKKKKTTSLNQTGQTVTREVLYEPEKVAKIIEAAEEENRFLQSVIDKSNLLVELELTEKEEKLFEIN